MKAQAIEQNIQDKLQAYHALLQKWQPKINLISNNSLDTAWERHFVDSMQISDLIPVSARAPKILFDLGCGAGFPGLVLAMMRDDLDVHLVESDQKKCAFLKTVSRETETSVQVVNARIESVSRETIPDIITARALASLKELFDYCEDWIKLNKDLILIFPKGENAENELKELSGSWHYECCTSVSKTDKNARILIFSQVGRI